MSDTNEKRRNIIDYKIVNLFLSREGYDAEEEMKKLLKDEYQPYGNLLMSDNNCIQAMVKYED